MKLKINKDLLPIKAHYFFFFAALGPVLPQMNVFGRQLGVSPEVMGLVTAVLPLLWAAAKPAFGYVVDYFTKLRKLIFITLIILMTSFYCGLWFLPGQHETMDNIYHLNDNIQLNAIQNTTNFTRLDCLWNGTANNITIYAKDVNKLLINEFYVYSDLDNMTCDKYEMEYVTGETMCRTKNNHLICKYELETIDKNETMLYGTGTFWWFVVLMCLGTVAFNVANCISDAICFDVLGSDRAAQYGSQRAWGTAGYGLTAFLGGWLVDMVSAGERKDFTPAFLLAAVFTLLDVTSCRKLKLPRLSSSDSTGRALRTVMRNHRVLIFITFAVVVGMFDSFIVYYLFWYIEDLAEAAGIKANVKLLEGVIVFGQSFVGELIFFFLSGRILNRFGYGNTMTFCLVCYSVRLGCVSLIQNPWWLVPLEALLQGPTYALCYCTIVGYAARVAPAGHSATMQGIVAGMDDGVGFALGSLLGGVLYKRLGGRHSFRALAALAAAAGALHAALQATVLREATEPETSKPEAVALEAERMLSRGDGEQIGNNAVYCETTVPLAEKHGA